MYFLLLLPSNRHRFISNRMRCMVIKTVDRLETVMSILSNIKDMIDKDTESNERKYFELVEICPDLNRQTKRKIGQSVFFFLIFSFD